MEKERRYKFLRDFELNQSVDPLELITKNSSSKQNVTPEGLVYFFMGAITYVAGYNTLVLVTTAALALVVGAGIGVKMKLYTS